MTISVTPKTHALHLMLEAQKYVNGEISLEALRYAIYETECHINALTRDEDKYNEIDFPKQAALAPSETRGISAALDAIEAQCIAEIHEQAHS